MKLGSWTENVKYYKELYKNAKPFENIVIPQFFNEEYANQLNDLFPLPTDQNKNWHLYHNPLEHKFSLNTFNDYPEMNNVFKLLQTDQFISFIKQITDIVDLENDPHLHGAGLHAYPNNGKLDIHLDYNIHPITKKERRVNLIIYMNKDWKEEYGGNIEFYDENKQSVDRHIIPSFNTAILFKTCDLSYHGLPNPIKCPPNVYRKSFAIYYVSPPRDNLTQRYKAEYFPRPNQPINDKLMKLYQIRKQRLITPSDLEDYPNWENDGNGYW